MTALRIFARLKIAVLLLSALIQTPATAREWRGGAGMGFGGSGLEKKVGPKGSEIVVYRAESPAAANVFLETLYSERIVVGLEHARGLRLGPLSSGLGFTSLALAWHYLGPAPDVTPAEPSNRAIFTKRWSPYTGGSLGMAFGTVNRDKDDVKSVSSSGATLGIKNGVDVLLRKNLGLRIEISYMFTFYQDANDPALLSHFAAWGGLFVPLF